MATDDEVFEAERPRLVGAGYRMLGSMADAEDVVQETWLRWDRLGPAGRATLDRPAAWLTTTSSRIALDRLKSAQHQREVYVGPWLPEPIITDGDPALSAELAESLTIGFLAVLERLGPVERAVFLLADVFAEPFATIATIVDRSEEACRQIAARARRRVRDERRRFDPDDAHKDELVHAFVAACTEGSLDEFRKVLSDDVVLVSDGGRDVHAARRPVLGVQRVARFLGTLVKRMPSDTSLEFHRVNGEPGLLVLRDGRPVNVIAFEVHDDRITGIRLVVNPDKLGQLGTSATGEAVAPRG
jgi:RNA polymerase sigma-70 factor (ECF subfamily)